MFRTRVVLLGLVGSMLLGCSRDEVSVINVGPSVAITPSSFTLTVGDTVRLTATVSDVENAYVRRFSSSDAKVARVDSIAGLVEAVGQGTATITVNFHNTSRQSKDLAGASIVKVNPASVDSSGE